MIPFCRQPAGPELTAALDAFNARAYWDCHHLLEPLWLTDRSPARDFYQGLIQVAGGLYHVDRGNRAGAVSLLGKGLVRLLPFIPVCREVLVARCRTEAAAVLAFVESCPAESPLPPLPHPLRLQLHRTTDLG